MSEHFKGVVWDHTQPERPGVYRYAVVGMIVSTVPIPELSGEHAVGREVVLDGPAELGDVLRRVSSRAPRETVGDARDILLSLGAL